MPSITQLIQSGTVCLRLREKQMFYEGHEVSAESSMDIIPATERSASMPSGPFWCAKTQSLLGPDGGFVGTDTCKPSRSCCETT
jgi:hypothetical protein